MWKPLSICTIIILVLISSVFVIKPQTASAAIDFSVGDYVEIKPTYLEVADGFYLGNATCIDNDSIIVGSVMDNVNGSESGSAHVLIRSGSTWSHQQKLVAVDGEAYDYFGASVSISGDTAVVGTPLDDDVEADSGSAYVFVRSGSTWSQQQKLTAADGATGDFFGSAVSIDGDTVVVGAYGDDDNGPDSGSAYVFVRSGSTWSPQKKLTASDGATGDYFGDTVDIVSDTLVAGAPRDDDNGTDSGSAYLFERSGGGWSPLHKLVPEDGAADDHFGGSVAISSDTLVIGAYGDDDNGPDSGSAYVCGLDIQPTWISTISTDDKLDLAPYSAHFDFVVGYGESVSTYLDTFVVGAPLTVIDETELGAAFVFERSGSGIVLQYIITPSDGVAGDYFGGAVGISGNTIVVGSPLSDTYGTDSGFAYVFELTPEITSVTPTSGQRGQTLDEVVIAGKSLTYTSTMTFGDGVTVDSFSVVDPTQITASITIDSDAELGPRDVVVTSPSGTATLEDGFTVDIGPLDITSVSPTSGTRGSTINCTIMGENLDQVDSVNEIDFGTGVIINSVTNQSPEEIAVNITVAIEAALGSRDVTATTPEGSDTLADGFTVTPIPNSKPNTPSNVSPSDGAEKISLTPTFESSAFSDPDDGDTHAASQWRIITLPDAFTTETLGVYDSGTDTTNKTTITIPSDNLVKGKTYYWQVRHQDNHGNWSEWSLETEFTTATGGGLCGTMLPTAPKSSMDLISGSGLICLLSAALVYMLWRQRRGRQHYIGS